MRKLVLVITASNFFEGSTDLEKSFKDYFGGENRKLEIDDIEEVDEHVAGIIIEEISLPKGVHLKSFMKDYIIKNSLYQECFGVYTLEEYAKPKGKELLTEMDM